MTLTRRGWALAAGTVALYGAGRLAGVLELSMLSAAGLVALVAGVVLTAAHRPRIEVSRQLHPRRLHAGVDAHAAIDVSNHGARRTLLLAVSDRFAGREARFAVPPVPAGGTARGAYRVPTRRRGVFAVGPLTVSVSDPLGLVQRAVVERPESRTTVFPRVEPVVALPLAAARDLVGGAVRELSRSRAGDEFHGLREYAVGDDLRRVHWKSTARTGELMIREHDVPWQARATLLLDERAARTRPERFERAVDAAASVATALHRDRSNIRLLTTDSGRSPFGTDARHLEGVLERLASVQRVGSDRFDAVVAGLHRQSASGALVALVGDAPLDELRTLAALRRRYGFVAVVRFGRHRLREPLPGAVLVDVPEDEGFAATWAAALGALGTGPTGVRTGRARDGRRSRDRAPRSGA